MLESSQEMTEQTDWQGGGGGGGEAKKATTKKKKKQPSNINGLYLGRSEVLRSFRHQIPAGTNPRTSHHWFPGEKKTGVKKRSDRRSSFKGREKVIVNQTNIRTVSQASLGKLLKDRVERTWDFTSALI